MGWSLFFLKRYDEAIEECVKAIALDPDFGNPYNDIGVYLMEQGHWREARPWLEQAADAPRYEERHFAWMNLARLYEKIGPWREALRCYRRAIDLEPDYQLAQTGIEVADCADELKSVMSNAQKRLPGMINSSEVFCIMQLVSCFWLRLNPPDIAQFPRGAVANQLRFAVGNFHKIQLAFGLIEHAGGIGRPGGECDRVRRDGALQFTSRACRGASRSGWCSSHRPRPAATPHRVNRSAALLHPHILSPYQRT